MASEIEQIPMDLSEYYNFTEMILHENFKHGGYVKSESMPTLPS